MIVDAPTDGSISTSLTVTQDFLMTTQSMPLNETGRHIKFVIAAKFNHDAPSGWPVLQIRKTVSSDNVTTLVMTRLDLEPRPTGYLNVFEYDLLPADVQPGDVVRIQPQSYEQQRYLLAYQTLSNPLQPQVYINMSTNNEGASFSLPSAASTSILSTSYNCETTNKISHINNNLKPVKSSTTNTPKSAATTNVMVSYESDSVKEQPVIAITGSVLGTLVIITLSVILIIVMFLTYQRKRNAKRFSPNVNTRMSANVSSGAMENVYIPDNMLQGGNQIVSNTNGNGTNIRAGTGNDLSLQDNPQEVSLLAVQWNHACMHMKGISLKRGSSFNSGHCLWSQVDSDVYPDMRTHLLFKPISKVTVRYSNDINLYMIKITQK